MNTEITTALIALFGTALGTFGGIVASSKLTVYRIEQLEKKVDKHNNVMERTYKLEQCQELWDEKLKVANTGLKDLENER